jgi:hypothetical protein
MPVNMGLKYAMFSRRLHIVGPIRILIPQHAALCWSDARQGQLRLLPGSKPHARTASLSAAELPILLAREMLQWVFLLIIAPLQSALKSALRTPFFSA